MDTLGWIQLALYVTALLAITKPLGLYLCKVLDVDGRTFLDPVLKPLEKLTYKFTGVDPHKEQDWKHYAFAMLLFSAVGLLFTYAILRLQAVLPLNPQNLPAVGEHQAVHLRHAQVENGKVEILASQFAERGTSVRRLVHLKTLSLERDPVIQPDVGFIIHNEDAVLHEICLSLAGGSTK